MLISNKITGWIYVFWISHLCLIESKQLYSSYMLQEKIKELSNIIASINSSLKQTTRLPSLRLKRPVTPIAEKIYYIPLGKVHLKKFLIDMAVDMNYLKNDLKTSDNLKATADVNAKLYEDKDLFKTFSRPVQKRNGSGHFEYSSPLFKVNLKSLPVGVQLFIPIHKGTSEHYQNFVENKKLLQK